VSSALGIPVLMISHGVSLHPFTWQLTDVVRALGWQPYKRFVFPKLIAKIDVLTTLDETASSQRFFDRDLARRLGKPVLPLVNAPANWTSCFRNRNQRKMQVLVVGYFSPIKNQLGALEVFSQLPNELQLKFVGERSGRYYEKCVRRVIELGLTDRVVFLEDSECNLEEEFANSLVVLSPSVTEVLPLTLIEAMASGTPFVATRVGAVPLLEGGFHASDIVGLKNSIRLLIDDTEFWQQCSDAGRRQYTERYTLAHVEAQLHDAIGATMNASAGKIKDFLVSERSVSEDLVMTASDDN
jgi:glycosyltransferase involved in cell wall biosynthesis